MPLVIALIAAVILAGTHWKAYTAGEKSVQAEWDAARLEASQEARRMESSRFNRVVEAQNAATQRKINLEAAAASARLDADRLRGALSEAARRLGLNETTLDTCRDYALTVNGLLDQCTENYRGMAQKASGHASDVRTLRDAWPKE